MKSGNGDYGRRIRRSLEEEERFGFVLFTPRGWGTKTKSARENGPFRIECECKDLCAGSRLRNSREARKGLLQMRKEKEDIEKKKKKKQKKKSDGRESLIQEIDYLGSV